MDFSPEQIRLIIEGLIILLLSIAVHEFGHAYVAHKLGDRLPESQGRVTLNPLVHADPIGTFLFPLLGLLMTGGKSFGFGWGRPVEVNPLSFSRRFRMRTGHMLVALAGPGMNVLFALVLALIHVTMLKTGLLDPYADSVSTAVHRAFIYAVGLNFILCFFNLIPAPPLDGGAVLQGVLPEKYQSTYDSYAPYGPFVLMAVIFVPGLAAIFVTPAVWMQQLLYRGLVAVFSL